MDKTQDEKESSWKAIVKVESPLEEASAASTSSKELSKSGRRLSSDSWVIPAEAESIPSRRSARLVGKTDSSPEVAHSVGCPRDWNKSPSVRTGTSSTSKIGRASSDPKGHKYSGDSSTRRLLSWNVGVDPSREERTTSAESLPQLEQNESPHASDPEEDKKPASIQPKAKKAKKTVLSQTAKGGRKKATPKKQARPIHRLFCEIGQGREWLLDDLVGEYCRNPDIRQATLTIVEQLILKDGSGRILTNAEMYSAVEARLRARLDALQKEENAAAATSQMECSTADDSASKEGQQGLETAAAASTQFQEAIRDNAVAFKRCDQNTKDQTTQHISGQFKFLKKVDRTPGEQEPKIAFIASSSAQHDELENAASKPVSESCTKGANSTSLREAAGNNSLQSNNEDQHASGVEKVIIGPIALRRNTLDYNAYRQTIRDNAVVFRNADDDARHTILLAIATKYELRDSTRAVLADVEILKRIEKALWVEASKPVSESGTKNANSTCLREAAGNNSLQSNNEDQRSSGAEKVIIGPIALRRNTRDYKAYRKTIRDNAVVFSNADDDARHSILLAIATKYELRDSTNAVLTDVEILKRIEKALWVEASKPVSVSGTKNANPTSLREAAGNNSLQSTNEDQHSSGVEKVIIGPIALRRNTRDYKAYRKTIRDNAVAFRNADNDARHSLLLTIATKYELRDSTNAALTDVEILKRIEKALLIETRTKGNAAGKKRKTVEDDLSAKRKRHISTAEGESALHQEDPNTSEVNREVDPTFLASPYIEEIAYHAFHGVRDGSQGMPPPPHFLLEIPPGSSASWSYDPMSRVVLGDFSNVTTPTKADVGLLLRLMERDDISVVSEGLSPRISGQEECHRFLRFVDSSFGSTNAPYHKFRRFDRSVASDGMVAYSEVDGHVQMRIPTYMKYLDKHQRSFEHNGDCSVSFLDESGNEASVDARDVVLYMVDVDMSRYVHTLNEGYMDSFKIPEVILGGKYCLSSFVPKQSMPFMGPNLYITPGGGYSSLHQDGFGTVDSGHSCLSGYNEVVMLRRLPELHKRRACTMIPTLEGKAAGSTQQAENSMYRMPHDDDRVDSPLWPTTNVVREWESSNYCPSVFVLKPGQHLHINKGRLHAFRKLTTSPLHQSDCHATHRASLLRDLTSSGVPFSNLCISIAFDWMYMGSSAEGINREIATTIESARLCRKRKTAKSLAIVESTVMALASTLKAPPLGMVRHRSEQENMTIARGILPSLQYLADKGADITTVHKELDPEIIRGVEVVTDEVPDAHCNPTVHPIDPFGNDYFCKTCSQELSNIYFHCNGCENLLGKDFNICGDCFSEGQFLKGHRMNSYGKAWFSDVHHTGGTARNLTSRVCGCHAGVCKGCEARGTCKKCSCTCHKSFTRRFRFRTPEWSSGLLQDCEEVAGGTEVKFAKVTVARLKEYPMTIQDGEAPVEKYALV